MTANLPDVTEAAPPIVGGEPVEVADGVFVLRDNRVPLVPNIGFVVGDRATLVVDTGLGRRNGEYVLAQAKRLMRRTAAVPDDHALPPGARLRRGGVRGRGDDRRQPRPA